MIELGISEALDIGSWDLYKALRLLGKSNVPLMEWIYSPIRYAADPAFLERIQGLADAHFVPAAGFYHYQSMAKKYAALCEADTYKLKHLFYALRTALAAHWVVKYQTFPPVSFDHLLDGLTISSSVREEVEALKTLKAGQPESYRHSASEALRAFLRAVIQDSEAGSKRLVVPVRDRSVLDAFFKEVVQVD